MKFIFIMGFFLFNSLFGNVIGKYSTLNRDEVIFLLRSKSKKRVLDIGYSANNWSSEFVTHYIDCVPHKDDSKFFLEEILISLSYGNLLKKMS